MKETIGKIERIIRVFVPKELYDQVNSYPDDAATGYILNANMHTVADALIEDGKIDPSAEDIFVTFVPDEDESAGSLERRVKIISLLRSDKGRVIDANIKRRYLDIKPGKRDN